MSTKLTDVSYIDTPCQGLQSWAAQLADLAKHRGIHPDKLLKGTKLFYQDFAAGTAIISVAQFYQLQENCRQFDNQHQLSFLLGRKLLNNNPLYSAFSQAESLCSLQKILIRAPLHGFNLFNATHKHHQGRHYFIINLSFGAINTLVEQFCCELFASFIAATCKWRIGNNSDLSFSFPYPEPKHIEQYQTNLQANCKFSQQLFMVSVSDELYNRHLIDSCPSLLQQSLASIGQQPLPAKPWLQAVREYITKHPQQNLETVAHYFAMSPATFKRKLKQHHTRFSTLQDCINRQTAVFNLTTLAQSNETLASTLNFTDLTNFRRAFKRWTGTTPSNLRCQLKSM
ncbi:MULTISPECIES: helix-turn-helix domain-containing protein [Pseudoalteromonas]|uniref:Helix-turn-helix domain-containing protein n=1 Tax=Pseudoalteromonas haloplanktis TaxID=228 RepID=A0ABU1BBP4_PSEHA|nr:MULTISPECIES: AraC family transcriptional regulator [Pseudoalteromonas]MDQ9091958.1 helix-turn-helix domain-containing protein [Pseudoalteromonas haloplanktis]